MAFLENLGKKVGEAAQAAAKKSGELVEITKLNMAVRDEEEKIQKIYTQIGKAVYDCYAAGGETGQNYIGFCEAVVASEQAIKGLKEKILEVKNLRICSGCGSEIERTVLFCAKCGTKQETAQPAAPVDPNVKLCPGCNAQLVQGATFCTACGMKVE